MRATAKFPLPSPKPVKTLVGFSLVRSWYRTEAEADEVAAFVQARGDTRYGGLMDGMPLGRERGADQDDPEFGRIYCVAHDLPVA
jgi:hypothetical protein